jgi:hypothetical protein
LCGETYSTQFLIAARIKPQSVCTEDERRDLAHVAMRACAFGCDALYETGYITVGSDGRIMPATVEDGSLLKAPLEAVAGRECLAFGDCSRAYFEWHRRNRFRC